MKGGRFAAVGTTADIRGARRQAHADVRREADDDRAGLHRLPQSRRRRRRCCTKCSSAIRSRSSSSPSPASSRSCARKARQTPPGTWVEGYFHDDTKLKDKRQLNVQRSRPGVDRASRSSCAIAAATRRSTTARRSSWRSHEEHAESGRRHVRSRRERRAERPRHRPRARASFNGVGQRPTFTPEQQRASASATASRTSRSSSSRYGLTSVHHEGGDLAAIQDVRARGDLQHRVSYEASGRVLDVDDRERHP